MRLPVDLEKIKSHLRVPHNLEDPDIEDYLYFAKNDIVEAVFDSHDNNLNKKDLEMDPSFQKAVIMLTTYYHENRLMISEVRQREAPFSVTHAIHTLRAHKDRYLKVDDT